MRRIFHTASVAAIFLCAGNALAQGARYDGIAIGERGAPVSNASIAVCTQPALTTIEPCSPLANLFTDATLTVRASNPVTADSLGNFHFYIAAGTYTLQTYGGQISPPFVQTDIGIGTGGGGAASAPNQNVIYVSPNCGTQANCYPAKFDVHVVTDASSTISSTTVTTGLSDPSFVAGDVGKLIFGTGHFTNTANGGTGEIGSVDLPLGTIISVVSAHQVTVSVAAAATNAGTMYLAWGHDDTANLQAALAAANTAAALPFAGAAINLPEGTAFISKGMQEQGVGGVTVRGQGFSTTLIPTPNFDYTTGVGNSCSGQVGGTAHNACFSFSQSSNFNIYGLGQPITGSPNVVLWIGGIIGDEYFQISGWGADNNTVVGLVIEPGNGGVQTDLVSEFSGGVGCETPPESGNFEADSLLCINDQGTAILTTAGIIITAHNSSAISYFGNAVNATAGAFLDDGGNTFSGPLVGNITQFGAFGGGLGASFQDGKEIAAPANPAAGNDRLFLNSATHLLDCHTSTGASCAPSGSTTLGTITPQPATKGDVVCANSTPTWTDCVQGINGRTVSGTTDTIVAGDRGTTIAYTSATAVASTLTSAATLGNNFYFTVNAQGAGAVTLTPGAGQINGASSLAVTQGQTCYIHSPDNVNYTADCLNGQITWSTGLSATPSAHGVTVTASGSVTLNYLNPNPDRTGGNQAPRNGNVALYSFVPPANVTFSHIIVQITTVDATNLYSFGIYDNGGNLVSSTTAASYAATGMADVASSQGSKTLTGGNRYYFAMTGNAATLTVNTSGGGINPVVNGNGSATTGGVLPATTTIPADSWQITGGLPYFALHP